MFIISIVDLRLAKSLCLQTIYKQLKQKKKVLLIAKEENLVEHI